MDHRFDSLVYHMADPHSPFTHIPCNECGDWHFPLMHTRETSVREFETGATRDTAEGKFELAKYFSPAFINGFARYMHKHQTQADGTRRDGDNWQKGMPEAECLESLRRHEADMWAILRGWAVVDEKGQAVTLEDAAYGVVFNVQMIMHQAHIKKHGKVLWRGDVSDSVADSTNVRAS